MITYDPLITHDNFRIGIKVGGASTRVSSRSLLTHLKRLRTNGATALVLTVSLNHLYFDTQPGKDSTEWHNISTDPADATAAAPTTPSNATAPDMTALQTTLEKLATAITAKQSSNGGPLHGSPGTQSPSTASRARYTFNTNALPTDVLDRYNDKTKDKLITGRVVASPFSTGNLFHLDGERIFLADGTLFLHDLELEEKRFLQSPVVCKDDSPFGIRLWYQAFTKHGMDHGYYIHPLYCFRKDHGQSRGFTCGDGSDDDLPRRFTHRIDTMSQHIYRLLLSSKMFPEHSHLHDYVQQVSRSTDGYQALRLILSEAHPAFHPTPATMVMAYPMQGDRSLIEYHALYQDYLQLNAFIKNQSASLDDPLEVDVFIKNAKHGDHLASVTRAERADSTQAHKYRSLQLVATLSAYLRMADSPALTIAPDPLHGVPPPAAPPDPMDQDPAIIEDEIMDHEPFVADDAYEHEPDFHTGRH
jgi:hypothetical protein